MLILLVILVVILLFIALLALRAAAFRPKETAQTAAAGEVCLRAYLPFVLLPAAASRRTFADRNYREHGRQVCCRQASPEGRKQPRRSLPGNAAAASQPMKKNYFVLRDKYDRVPS